MKISISAPTASKPTTHQETMGGWVSDCSMDTAGGAAEDAGFGAACSGTATGPATDSGSAAGVRSEPVTGEADTPTGADAATAAGSGTVTGPATDSGSAAGVRSGSVTGGTDTPAGADAA